PPACAATMAYAKQSVMRAYLKREEECMHADKPVVTRLDRHGVSAEDAGRPDPGRRKVAVVVAGMHRSGTSALTRTLGLVGCELPQQVRRPAQDNARGFWESVPVKNLNAQILASAGSSWDDWQAFNSAW